MKQDRNWLRWIYKISYWVIPALLLYFVFRRIDFQKLLQVLKISNPWLIALGVAYYPLVVFIGAERWLTLLRACVGNVPRKFVLQHYWTGLAIGYFMPGSLGWDVYRIVVAGRRFGRYAMNAVVIVLEKLSALFCCASIIVVLAPSVPLRAVPALRGILHWAAWLSLSFAAIVIVAMVVGRNRFVLQKVQAAFAALGGKILDRVRFSGVSVDLERPLKELVTPVISLRCLLPVVTLSFAVQILGGLANQVFFMALGFDISVSANLFLSPVLFFIFLVPISFGSLGVREAVYIGLYGIWGVPAETALLISFFNLIGVLLNNAVGGLIILGSGLRKEESGSSGSPHPQNRSPDGA
jgi:uncharacterized protein (TIRG00374 family)